MMATVLLVAVATFGAYQAWDKATRTREDAPGLIGGDASSDTVPEGSVRPAEGQVLVTGLVSAAHFEGLSLGALPTPFTVNTSSRGVGGATFTPVVVAGNTTSIDWQAGQPLPLTGDGGSIQLSGITCDVTADGIVLGLDGVRTVTPGEYRIATSVAVGSQPRDAVTFTASEETTVEFRGGATTPLPSPPLIGDGTGAVTLEGTLSITHPDGQVTAATTVGLDGGNYRIELTPAVDGGFNITATLQGNIS